MIDRLLSKYILKLAHSYPVLSITGPRQSGKTTLVKALFPGFMYYNLENFDDRAAASDDPRGFLVPHKKHGVIIDEAQKVPELFSYLQNIVDESGEMGKYILTGSQNFLLLEKITQSLAGRVAVLHLMPFGFDELQGTGFQRNTLNEYLFTGMYPAIYDRNMDPTDYYPSYLQTYVERDVRSLKNIGDLNTFHRFIQLCAGRTGQLLNLSSIGIELGITHKTVKSWISILEASFIIFLLYPHYRNFNKRLVKQPKLLFYDTGLVCSLLGIDSAKQVATHYLRGSIFENFILSEYLKNRLNKSKRSNIYFWRDRTGNEIDMLIENGSALSAVEIKSGATINDEFFDGLRKYRKISGTGIEFFFLVYGGDRNIKRKDAQVLGWNSIYQLPGL